MKRFFPAPAPARPRDGREPREALSAGRNLALGVKHCTAWDLYMRLKAAAGGGYSQVDNPAKTLRINYWHCGENADNEVFRTPEGSTQYKDFQFTDQATGKEQ